MFCYTVSMINKWHSFLAMPKHDMKWHQNDLADELAEFHEERLIFMKWSELSDVVYTCSMGRWSGHQIQFPFSKFLYFLGVLYMLPKYTGRWLFFRRAGKKLRAKTNLHEVRNPKKTHKLHHIAEKYNLNPQQFQAVCEKQLKYWFLLP